MYRILAQSRLLESQRGLFSYLIATILLTSLAAVPAAWAQTTWHVDDDAPNDPGPGDPAISDPLEDGSPEHPFDAIQESIDAADDGDTVLVLDGTYTGDGNRDLDFGGRSITVRSQNGPDTCIIDCQASEADPHRGFDFHSGETAGAVLEGITIRNGYETVGGAIRCIDNSSPTITDCTVMENMANQYGSGIHCQNGSSPTIADCVITANAGDGIFCFDGNPTITDCTITGNAGSGVNCHYYANPMIYGLHDRGKHR